jgi:hypothetical protein
MVKMKLKFSRKSADITKHEMEFNLRAEFKRDAVFQVTDLGDSVEEASARLGVSTKSLYN